MSIETEGFTALHSHPAVQRLPAIMLRVAVAECVLDRKPLAATVDALWREDPHVVTALYAAAVQHRAIRQFEARGDPRGMQRLMGRKRRRRTGLLSRRERGITVTDLAKLAGFDREAVACAMEHHGFLVLTTFGGRNGRRMVSEQAEREGLGHNPHGGSTHVAYLEGHAKATPFPVFYPEHVPNILGTLGLPGIRDAAAAIPTKRARLRWLLDHHGYLPNATIAEFAGCLPRAVERGRAKRRSQVI